MALYHQGRYREASTELTVAERSLKDDALLYDYAGVAAAEQQSYEQASERFLRAREAVRPRAGSDARVPAGGDASLPAPIPTSDGGVSVGSRRRNGHSGATGAATDSSPLSASFEAVERHYGLSLQYRLECRAAAGRMARPNGISHKG